jgi:hypothetical protein
MTMFFFLLKENVHYGRKGNPTKQQATSNFRCLTDCRVVQQARLPFRDLCGGEGGGGEGRLAGKQHAKRAPLGGRGTIWPGDRSATAADATNTLPPPGHILGSFEKAPMTM